MTNELRHALRSLRKSPGFTTAAVLTLALGIGANTAVFSLVRGVLLRSLPYPQSERIVSIRESNSGRASAETSVSLPNFLDWEAQNRVFSAMGAYFTAPLALAERGEAARLEGAAVTPGFFATMGVRPEIGRVFAAEETRPGRDRVVILSHGVWTRVFGADPTLVGRSIQLEGEAYLVAGIMPAGFRFPEDGADVWVPLTVPDNVATQRGAHYLSVVARLAPGTALEQASAEMRLIADRLRRQYAKTNAGYSAVVEPLREELVGAVRPALWMLFGAVAFVTLIACANVANLLLARGARRGPELAIRAALGAGRARIVRQLLTESLLLALAGAGAGLVLAAGVQELIVRLAPADIPRLAEVGIDAGVLAFTAVCSIAAACLFGLAPALSAVRSDPARALRSGTSRVSAGGATRLRRLLVVGEMGLALLLLTGGGLLLKSLAKLSSVDPGFRAQRVVAFELALPQAAYPDDARIGTFMDTLLSRIRAIPAVRSAGAIFGLPLTGLSFSSSFRVAGKSPDADEFSAQLRVASVGYFRTVGIPLVAGRLFDETDRPGAPMAVLASRSAARRFFPKGDALHQRIRFGARPGGTRIEGEVVGIVGDVRDRALETEPAPEFYGNLAQAPVSEFHVVVRTEAAPEAMLPALAAEVAKLDAGIPVAHRTTLREVVAGSTARPRFYTLLLLCFAGIAIALSAVGIYGVVAYTVSQRTREIGIRMALGADGREIRRLILGEGVRLAAAGVALGLVAAVLLTRLLRGLLFEVAATDPATHAAVAGVIAAVALAACSIPARRAARLDPLEALRNE
jgi:putative ABC transport system permease protein